jgi:hypothetical protein
MNALQVPQWRPLWRELLFSRAFFYMSLKFIIKIFLIKRTFHPSLKGPRIGASPYVPQNRAPMESDAHFHSLT